MPLRNHTTFLIAIFMIYLISVSYFSVTHAENRKSLINHVNNFRPDGSKEVTYNKVKDRNNSAANTVSLVQITSPKEGEMWKVGISKRISWVGYIEPDQYGRIAVQKEFSTDNGATWQLIEAYNDQTDEFGFTNWIVPNTPSNSCLIKLIYNGNVVYSPIFTIYGKLEWEVLQYLPRQTLESVFFLNPNIGWIAGNNGLLKTTDGGTTWFHQTTGINDVLFGVFFIDKNVGWTVGLNGFIAKTNDGGTTWISQISNHNDILNRVVFFDSQNGCVLGRYAFLITTNGGTTWIKQPLPTNYGLTGLSFLNKNTGWISSETGIYKTTNAGQSWNQMTNKNTRVVSFLNDNSGWVLQQEFQEQIGMKGRLLKTTDGGQNWTQQLYDSLHSFSDLFFFDINNGYLLGNGSDIFSTTDGGNSWTQEGSGVDDNFISIYAFSADYAWIAGAGGTILRKLNYPIIPISLISYWKLDDTPGAPCADVLGINNAYSTTTRVLSWGKLGAAQWFGGNIPKIYVPANSSFDFAANSSFSVEFWFWGSDLPSTDKSAIGRYIPQTGSKWYVGLNANDGRAKFYYSTGGYSAAIYGKKIVDNSWHHIAATRNGTSGAMKIYVDGVLTASGARIFNTGFSSPTANLNIGWLSFQDDFSLQGGLDEIAIYNIELTPEVIIEHYNNILAGKNYLGETGAAPVITSSSSPKTAFVGQTFSFYIESIGTPRPTISSITSPAGMRVRSSGSTQWKPTAPGSYNVVVEARNGINPPARLAYTINVTYPGLCTPSMVSYWRLDENSGTQYMDDMGINTASAGTFAPLPVPGILGNAQEFAGNFSKINVTANSSFDFAADSSFSVEFWYKGAAPPVSEKSAIGRYIPSTRARWFVGLNAGDGKARFYMSTGEASAAVNGSVITDNKWHYITATRNGKSREMRIYVDGVLKASATRTFTTGFTSPTDDLNIGWLNCQDGYYINGSLDEIAIYNSELTSEAISQHYINSLNGQGYCLGDGYAPKITSTPGLNGIINQLYTYDVNAKGIPAPTYSLITYPSGMSIDPVTGKIQWTPSSTGVYDVTVQAINSVNPPALQTFKITVSNAQQCPTSMISYWKFDDTTPGYYSDYIGNNNFTSNYPPQSVTGQVGGALQLWPCGNPLEVPANTSFDFTAGSSFSIEFWYKGLAQNHTVDLALIGRNITETNALWFVGLNTTANNNYSKAKFYMRTGSSSFAIVGSEIGDGKWHHVAATRNGTKASMKLYVDGVLTSSAYFNLPAGFTSTKAALTFMQIFYQDYAKQDINCQNGCLDEVAIYKSELSSSEILQHYNNGLTGVGYCSLQGLGKQSLSETNTTVIPAEYRLFQNYPNPFNPVTTIVYHLPAACHVHLTVYDILGNKVAVVVNEEKPAGVFNIEFNGSSLSSGIYFYKIQAGEFISVKKLLLLK